MAIDDNTYQIAPVEQPLTPQTQIAPQNTPVQPETPTNKIKILLLTVVILFLTSTAVYGSYTYLKNRDQKQQLLDSTQTITQESALTSSDKKPINIDPAIFNNPDLALSTTTPITGSLKAGVTTEVMLDIDQSVETIFYLTTISQSLDFLLTSPSGTVINSEYASLNPNLAEHQSSKGGPELPPNNSYIIKTPELGKWKAKITATTDSEFKLLAFFNKGIALQADFDKKSYPSNTEAIIAARLVKSESSVSVSRVYATISLPDKQIIKLDLIDSGNGIYAAKFRTPDSTGYLTADVNIEGIHNGYPFNRSAVALGSVNSQQVKINDIYQESAVDTNGDGRFDQLNFNFELEAAKYIEVGVQAELYAANGEVITQRGDFIKLQNGKQNISLQFSGRDIFESGINGPYEIRRIFVTPIDTGITSDSREKTVLTTKAYSYVNFSER